VDAGVRNRHVDAAEALDGRGDGLLEGGDVGDVRLVPASRRSGSSPTSTTFAPRSWKRAAEAAPMPRAAPVMRMVLPVISCTWAP
jgi:hypothetical protein